MVEGALLLALILIGVIQIFTRRRLAFVTLLASVLLLQNIVVMVLLRFQVVSGSGTQVLLAAKEVLLMVGLVLLGGAELARTIVRRRVRFDPLLVLIVLWLVTVAAHALSFGPPWLPRLAGARAVMILPALFLFGYWLSLSARGVQYIIRVMVVIGVSLAAFGILEAYVLPESFWLSAGHEEFYLEKINRPVQGSLYSNMRYWLGDQPVRRVASITGDPLISSYPMATVIVIVAAYYASRTVFRVAHLRFILPVAFATLLTLSRGAALTVILAVGLLFVARQSARRMLLLTGVGLLVIVSATALFGDAILSITTGAGHIDQLIDGLQRGVEKPLGFGLGTASSLAAGIARTSDLERLVIGGGDSFMGSLATQMGFPAMVLFYSMMLMMVGKLSWHFMRLQRGGRLEAWWFGAAAAMLAGLLITSAVNESGFGFVASGLIYILAGALYFVGETDLARERYSRQSKWSGYGERLTYA